MRLPPLAVELGEDAARQGSVRKADRGIALEVVLKRTVPGIVLVRTGL